MITAVEIFGDEIKEAGKTKIKCPSCEHDDCFQINSDSAHCFHSDKHFNLLECIALKFGLISCAEGRYSGEESVVRGDIYQELKETIIAEYGQEWCDKLLEQICPIISLKNISVNNGFRIRTEVIASDLQPGMAIRKGYNYVCPLCKKEVFKLTYYSKATCFDLFKEDGCQTKKGKNKINNVLVNIVPVNDTGIMFIAADVKDKGQCPQFSNVFLPTNLLPKDASERELYELELETKPFIVYGNIRANKDKNNNIQWYIYAESINFVNKEETVNSELLSSKSKETRDNKWFDENFLPDMVGNTLLKKILAIEMLSPLKIKLPNEKIIDCTGSILICGDPGLNKTQATKGLLNYCMNTSSDFISAEDSSPAGLLAANVRSKNTGNFYVKIGKIPKCHQSLCIIDGYGKLTPETQAQLRGIKAEHQFEANKVSHVKKACSVRLICLANLINKVTTYFNKHLASYDIAISNFDIPGKFNGADRRREDHVIVLAETDISSRSVFEHKSKVRETEANIEYWNNKRIFAWNLQPEKIIWEAEIDTYIINKLEDLRNIYPEYTNEYGILSKGAKEVFMKQLPAVSILHDWYNDNGTVIIQKQHVDWLITLYKENFIELGLNYGNNQQELFKKHAEAIIEIVKTDKNLYNLLVDIIKFGSYIAVERAGILSKSQTIRNLKNPIKYVLGDETYYYSFIEGSVSCTEHDKSDGDVYFKIKENTGLLDGILRSGVSSWTTFGLVLKAVLCQKIRNDTNDTNEAVQTGSAIITYNNNNKNILGINPIQSISIISSIIDDKTPLKHTKPSNALVSFSAKKAQKTAKKTKRDTQFYENTEKKASKNEENQAQNITENDILNFIKIGPKTEKQDFEHSKTAKNDTNENNEIVKIGLNEIYEKFGNGSPVLLHKLVETGKVKEINGTYVVVEGAE